MTGYRGIPLRELRDPVKLTVPVSLGRTNDGARGAAFVEYIEPNPGFLLKKFIRFTLT
jgi:hypothetical protein